MLVRFLSAEFGRRERDPTGITDALAVVQARPSLLAELGRVSTPTGEGKVLAVALLHVGRKARVTLLLTATEATSDALGAAIADSTALRVLHACRHTDVRLVLGPQMLAGGWRPARLHSGYR